MSFRAPGISGGSGFSNLARFGTGQFRVSITKHGFFDRRAVQDALKYMNFHGLSRASLAVRRIAMKSIKQKGHARPKTKIEKLNVGMTLSELVNSPGIPSRTKGMLIRKLAEIQFRPPSQPGTPPNTHTDFSHMLGFRRNIYNAWDSSTQSAVAGPMDRGEQPGMPALHEFGRSKTLRAYMYLGRTPSKSPLVKWWDEGLAPKSPLWKKMKRRKQVKYPKRPFMRPALTKAIQRGDIARHFRNSFGGP
jgi:hypothetical protein